jgi:hypothetical protein
MAITRTLLPIGRYQGKILGQRLVESKKKLTPGLTLNVLVLHNLSQPEISLDLNRDLTLWFTDSNFDITQRQLEKLGYTGDDLRDLDPNSENHHSFAGLTIQLSCTHKESEDDGETYESLNLIGGGNPELKDVARLAHFARLMKKNKQKNNGNKDDDPWD